MIGHPYRGSLHKMSPLWFDTGHNRDFVDLRLVSQLYLDLETGKWIVYIADRCMSYSSEAGARLYNALRAYSESHYE